MVTAIYASKFAKTTQVNKQLFLFSLFWFLGLMLGVYYATLLYNSFVPYILDATRQSISSYIRQLVVMFFPWILSLFLFRLPTKLPFMLLITAKAFSFSFSTYAVLLAFSGAGWLIRYLFLFSATLSVLAFLRYWICSICGSVTRRTVVQTVIFVIFVVSLDFWIVSPYLISLF